MAGDTAGKKPGRLRLREELALGARREELRTISDLEARVSALEDVEAIRRQFMHMNELFDAPYDADGLADLFTEDGYLEACDGQFSGRRQIHEFFQDLAATFQLHYAMNGVIDIAPSSARATGRWYGWETPVVDGDALIGAFSSHQEYEKVDGGWRWTSLRETAHFLCAVRVGWVQEATPRQERRSLLQSDQGQG